MASLETKRLLLRRWLPQDLRPYARMCSDPDVMRWIGDGRTLSHHECAAAIRKFERDWAERGFGLFAVELKGSAEFIGFCGLSIPTFLPEIYPSVEIGWRFAAAVWGQGIGTEAAQASMTYAFDEAGLDEIVAIHQIGNDASERIMQKLGMHFDLETVDPNCGRRVNVYRKRREQHAPHV